MEICNFEESHPCCVNQVTKYQICITYSRNTNMLCYQVKGKAIPLQAWSGPEGSRKLRFPDFVTTAQDGGKVVSLTHRPLLPPRNVLCTHFY